MTCGTQEIDGNDVHPNQNSEIGRMTAPMIIGGNRSSGIALPCLMYARLKFVAVDIAMVPVAKSTPMMKAQNGRELTPSAQPRSSWNEMGYCSLLAGALTRLAM